MMAQEQTQISAHRVSGFYEAPQEGPIAKIQARMLKLKHHILGPTIVLSDEDKKESQKMVELNTQEARDEAYDEWIIKISRIRDTEHERQIIQANLEGMKTDHLTGLGNRRYLEEEVKQAFAKIKRSRHSKDANETPTNFSLIMMDMDFFKKLNDQLGHPMGDKAIKALVEIVKKMLRGYDSFARVGGEEFMILMEAPEEDALAKAEEIREEVEKNLRKMLAEGCREAERKRVSDVAGTVSIGVTGLRAENMREDWQEAWDLIRQEVDDALYVSKRNGRNQVTKYTTAISGVSETAEAKG